MHPPWNCSPPRRPLLFFIADAGFAPCVTFPETFETVPFPAPLPLALLTSPGSGFYFRTPWLGNFPVSLDSGVEDVIAGLVVQA